MNRKELFEYTFDKIKNSSITSAVAQKLTRQGYDRDLGELICEISYRMQNCDLVAYENAIEAFIEFSYDFLRLQVELEESGNYRNQTFEQVANDVYLDTKLMRDVYMKGLLLTEAFWVNHTKIFSFFIREFCSYNDVTGTVMEVPVGTGIFISEFCLQNPAWEAIAFDLSDGAVEFSKELMLARGMTPIPIHVQNVFELSEEKQFDRIICGELLEHLEDPVSLLKKMRKLLKPEGKMMFTTAIWAAAIDHIYLFRSSEEVREMIRPHFNIEKELVLNVFDNKGPEDKNTPINYACILS